MCIKLCISIFWHKVCSINLRLYELIMKGNILILGASPNPNRTSFMAAKLLKQRGYKLSAIGNKKSHVEGVIDISNEIVHDENVDAVTVFLKPERQKLYYDYILDLHPKSIIFNPGTENPELEQMAAAQNIKVISCCTIALLSVGML